MPKEKCNYLLPVSSGFVASDSDDSLECLLAEDHEGDHLIRISDRKYLAWSPMDPRDCDEEDCAEIEYCGCFVFEDVSRGTALRRIKKEGPG